MPTRLVRRYFELEDPATIHPVGLELKLEAQVDGIRHPRHHRPAGAGRGRRPRGHRLQDRPLPAPSTTSRAASAASRFYALLCQELFGVLPTKVQLLYLGDGLTITTEPTEQSIRALKAKLRALWQAIELACEREDFRPRPGPLCNWCSFQRLLPGPGRRPRAGRRSSSPQRRRRRGSPRLSEADADQAAVA